MKIELKNVKHASFASRETTCFEASIYIDGKKAGSVRNDGRGSEDEIFPYELRNRIDTYAAILPMRDVSAIFGDVIPHLIPESAGSLIGALMDDWMEQRDLKRMCSKKVLFRIPGHTYSNGEYHTYNYKFTPEVKIKLIAKYGAQVEILNESIV